MFTIVRKPSQKDMRTIPASLLSEWDPFRAMESWLRQGQFADNYPTRQTADATFTPQFDVKETKDSFLFKADLPGLKEQDLDISLTGNRLTISGKRDAEENTEGDNVYLWERAYGSFSRSFTLPDSADAEKIQATMKDGVLTLVLPKRAESQPRRITLNKPQH